MIGHFFGPRREALPDGGELPDLKPEDAVAVERFGDLGLFDGSWPVLGRVTGWQREDWPAPAFRRVDVVSGEVRRVVYDDADPAEEIAAERVAPGEAEGLPSDGVQGALGMSRLVARRLSSTPRSTCTFPAGSKRRPRAIVCALAASRLTSDSVRTTRTGSRLPRPTSPRMSSSARVRSLTALAEALGGDYDGHERAIRRDDRQR